MADGRMANFSTAPAGTDANTHVTRIGSQINWGQVAKGALIVTAVVVAVAVVYPLAVSGVTVAMHSSTFGPLLQGAYSAAISGINYLIAAAHGIVAFASNFWSAVAPAVGLAGHAAPAMLSETAIAGAAHGAGVLAAGGTAVLGASAALSPLNQLHLVDPVTITHTSPPPMADSSSQTMGDDGTVAGTMATTKATVAAQASAAHTHHDFSDLAHHSTEHLNSHGSPNSYNGHGAQGGNDNQPDQQSDAPDAPDEDTRLRSRLRNAENASKKWGEKVGGSRADARRSADFFKRNDSYALQADTDRLNKALAANDNGIA